MRIIPVLDLQAGQIVRGIAGQRRQYRPVASRLTRSSAPVDVAEAFAHHFGCRELYLADLDAIAGAEPAWEVYSALRQRGFALWVDAGVRRAEQGQALARTGIETIVAGLETLAGPSTLAELVQTLGQRIVFSLDLRGGVPLGDTARWSGTDAWSIACEGVALGVRRLLVLDLVRVGMASGTGTEDLCARITRSFPEVEVSAGGGVRDRADLCRLRDAGVKVALVASALHDGVLTRADLEGL
jgi:phosphoribosylformimino-5-aminoimidazole carboxamide ribotide isomerase